MGLSASQARLLTITSRKSDCEFQSMRYSHEKIALSRSMTDISNEYQNSLNQTKLIYDFYGTNDKSLGVSYDLFMSPSELNGYMPIITTDAAGKVVLDSKFAAAAKAAGIPHEGLGCLPSDVLRNRFLTGLADTGAISQVAAANYKEISYSQGVGVGSIETVNKITTEMSYESLVEAMKGVQVNVAAGADFSIAYNLVHTTSKDTDLEREMKQSGVYCGDTNANKVTNAVSLGDVLSDNYTLLFKAMNNSCERWGTLTWELACVEDMQNYWTVSGNGGYELLQSLRDALDTNDTMVKAALNYADMQIATIVNLFDNCGNNYPSKLEDEEDNRIFNNNTFAQNMALIQPGAIAGVYSPYGPYKNWDNSTDHLTGAGSQETVGYYWAHARNNGDLWSRGGLSINLGNVLKAYLTYFADAMNNFSKEYYVDDSVSQIKVSNYKPEIKNARTITSSNMIGSTKGDSVVDCKFNVVTDTNVNTTEALASTFYDSIFNQICLRGWVENDNVIKSDYLQDMYKNGMMFLTAVSDDGYYYQNNYGAYPYVKEVTDDEAIARAEAKYNTEKAKINHKEEIIDMKMKNLDTEISSLTTEYDTIKSLINKNIERGFKRYEA